MQITITDLVKSYGSNMALDHINLSIEGGMYGLLGPNGAGKTTLMRIIATLLPPTSGKVTVCGLPLRKRGEIRGKLGYLPQEFSFYPQFSVYEVMDYLGILSGINDRRERKRRCEELLHRVNLWEERKTKAKALSGGMKRRLGIAQALLNDPQILIVDEPTAGLDPEERVRFRNVLSDFAANRTVIHSTHIVEDIEFACEHLAILNHGKLAYAGKVKDMVLKAQGIVWNLPAKREQLDDIRSKYRIISYVGENDSVNIRLLSAVKPAPEADPLKPNIEDAYLGLVGGLTQ